MIIAVLFIAPIPWAICQPVTRWHSAMQTISAQRTYRFATYVASLTFSAVSLFVPLLIMMWFMPLVAQSG